MSGEPTVGDKMRADTQDAIDHAREHFRVDLDYSVESIREVEAILRQLFDAIPRGLKRLVSRRPPAERLETLARMYGGYVGEVMRRCRGGDWVFDTEVIPGSQVICLRKRDDRVFPPAKVYKRLTNGPEDDAWFYFQAIERTGKELAL